MRERKRENLTWNYRIVKGREKKEERKGGREEEKKGNGGQELLCPIW